jgi:FixJ family two-component response regulator
MPDKLPPQPVVFVVDDDAALRESLADLFASVDLRVATFASAADFLRKGGRRRCRLPGARCPPAGLERPRFPG